MQIQTNAEFHVSHYQKMNKQIKVYTSIIYILYFYEKEYIIYGTYNSELLAQHFLKRASHEGYSKLTIVPQELTHCKDVK